MKLHSCASLTLSSIFTYFIARVLIYSYDGYAALALQLDTGYFYLTILEQIAVKAARSLAIASALAFAVCGLRVYFAEMSKPESA